MISTDKRREEVASFVKHMFNDYIPYNKVLGLEITGFEKDCVEIRMPWREDLVGNAAQQILHGG